MPRMSVETHYWLAPLAMWGYLAADLATFVFLTFFDCYRFTWWNWPIALVVNGLLAQIWPIYWGILRPIFGGGC